MVCRAREMTLVAMAVVLLAFTGCGETDRSVRYDEVEGGCGGELLALDGDEYCVYDEAAVDADWECPAAFPFRHEVGDFTVCSGAGTLPEDHRDAFTPDVPCDGGECEEIVEPGRACLATHNGVVQFGETSVGAATVRTVRIENCSMSVGLELRDISITDDGGGAFTLQQESLPGALPHVIAALESVEFVIEFSPEDAGEFGGEVTLVSDHPNHGTLTIPLGGAALAESCSTVAGVRVAGAGDYALELQTQPLQTVEFSPSNGGDDSDTRYEWSVITRPQGSRQQLNHDQTVNTPSLWLDVAGVYEVELAGYDEESERTCAPFVIVIHAVPDTEIYIQLTWSIPSVPQPANGNGTDIDLHYLHPIGRWDQAPGDIHWKNRSQNWGTYAEPSEASLDIDDLWGLAPESISHGNPRPDLTYAIGAYYFSDKGNGPSDATVRIYIDGALRGAFHQRLSDKEFWFVASIAWPSTYVTEVGAVTRGFPE